MSDESNDGPTDDLPENACPTCGTLDSTEFERLRSALADAEQALMRAGCFFAAARARKVLYACSKPP